jgi:hypothetical protein
MKPVTTPQATPAPARLHFWRRREGSIGEERRRPPTWAALDDGQVLQYHAAGVDRAEIEALLSTGVLWHWEYLGQGVIDPNEVFAR